MDGPADQPGMEHNRIGDWAFDERGQTLSGASGKVRLEYRAARLLALFVRHRGEVLSRDRIAGALWPGRTLSANSVAVVIGDLRKALGDDARVPRYIETVPKRGYRMPAAVVRTVSEPASPGPAAGRLGIHRRVLVLIAGLAAIVLGLLVVFGQGERAGPPSVVVTINDVRNETGLARYDAAAVTVSEIGAAYLSAAGVPILLRDRWDFDAADPSRGLFEDFGAQAAVTHISSTLVREGDQLRLVMFANDPRTDRVIWSFESEMNEDGLAGTVRAALDSFLDHQGLRED